jgi:hypothetical protein
MRHVDWRDILAGLVAAAMIGIAYAWLASVAKGSPIPFAKPPARKPALSRGLFIGEWEMRWGELRSRVTLKENGSYLCRWGSVAYVGSWGLDSTGRLWITETATPQDFRSWHSYAVRIDAVTMSGKVEAGAAAIAVSLKRVK